MNNSKILYEISWEVCNKVGGIHTVITSKMPQAIENFEENLIYIGPLLNDNPGFVESTEGDLATLNNRLSIEGINAKTGYWDINGKPKVLLIAIENIAQKNEILYYLWERYGVDSMNSTWDYEEPVLFGIQAGRAIEALAKEYAGFEQYAHFHEWMTGSGLLWLKDHLPEVATLFTTHATVLGRSMAGNGIDLYRDIQGSEPQRLASSLQVTPKHSLEVALAKNTDCFSTVSSITGTEAEFLLGKKPDIILPNGYSDVSQKKSPQIRDQILEFASTFTGQRLYPQKTTLIATSGRYEFRNKGLDIFIESLKNIEKNALIPEGHNLVAFLLIATGNQGSRNKKEDQPFHKIATHPLPGSENDPVINQCLAAGLDNHPGSRVKIIFVPAYLSKTDPLFPFDYHELLAGFDLTVFPSYYEPWGYTPLESIAAGVPTVTTNLAGFGNWIENNFRDCTVVEVLNRKNQPDYVVASQLDIILTDLVKKNKSYPKDKIIETASGFYWKEFFTYYLDAYRIAMENKNQRMEQSTQMNEEVKYIEISGSNSRKPRLRTFAVRSVLPAKIEKLRKLAYNLWWSWNDDATLLFERLDPKLFKATGNNPVSLLENIRPGKLENAGRDKDYMLHYQKVMQKFDAYMEEKRNLLSVKSKITSNNPVAYFSMEYGFHESLPVYSGGLGILSGDHIKSSSDLNIPLVGIGLLYRKGYFKQGISRTGEQSMKDFKNDFSRMAVTEVKIKGRPFEIILQYPGREVSAKVWKVQVGRIPVYLLDTDLIKNAPADREITGRLYGGGKVKRIEQEILLGIGGIHLLNALGLKPSVYHLNEGHSAFMIIQRVINLMNKNGLDFETARQVVKACTVFTTHTPVPAGNETFNMQLISGYFKDFVEEQNLGWKHFMQLAGRNENDNGDFEMTVLALKNSVLRNGVSKLHGVVSRKMWQRIWPGLLMEEIPITHVTNGVHFPTWLHPNFKTIFRESGLADWENKQIDRNYLSGIKNIPNNIIWEKHLELKEKFFGFVKEKTRKHWLREGDNPTFTENMVSAFSPEPLTIGFARRFATYKRATLFLHDFERFKSILLQEKYPVQFIFAGKAHPDDVEGQKLIQRIVTLSRTDEFMGKIIFIEDYDMRIARKLVSSVDIWLNNPLRPHEASGTSGMKAAINGVINCSILDGWWDEAYEKHLGWVIGNRDDVVNIESQNIFDSDWFYNLLEREIMPLYYERDNNGIPNGWVDMMKNSMFSVSSGFNTHRMLKDYFEKIYSSANLIGSKLQSENFVAARTIAEWQKSITTRFESVQIIQLKFNDKAGHDFDLNESFNITLLVNKGQLNKDELKAQVVVVPDKNLMTVNGNDPDIFDEVVDCREMTLQKEEGDILEYSIRYKAKTSGKFIYGVRLVPFHPDDPGIADLNKIVWA